MTDPVAPPGGWQPGGPHPGDPLRAEVHVRSRLTMEPLDPMVLLAEVAHPQAGASALFAGTVRDHHEGAAVTGLEYEAWEGRAEETLARIVAEVAAGFPTLRAVVCEHRVGPLDVGEHAIVAAASAPHRAPAQAAVAELVERVKAEVPIWKREALAEGGHRWPGVDTAG